MYWLLPPPGTRLMLMFITTAGRRAIILSTAGNIMALRHPGIRLCRSPVLCTLFFSGDRSAWIEGSLCDYWLQNVNHTLINYKHCVENPKNFKGYGPNCWGLTASDTYDGYNAHSPDNDLGTISPTASTFVLSLCAGVCHAGTPSFLR